MIGFGKVFIRAFDRPHTTRNQSSEGSRGRRRPESSNMIGFGKVFIRVCDRPHTKRNQGSKGSRDSWGRTYEKLKKNIHFHTKV